MEKDKNPDNSGNEERRSAWNRPSNGDSETEPVMGAVSWPPLSETTDAPSSPDSFRPSVPHSKPPEYLDSFQERLTLGSASTKNIFPPGSSSSSVPHSKPPEYLDSFQERLTLGSASSASTKDILPPGSSSSSIPHTKPPEYLDSFQERLTLGSSFSDSFRSSSSSVPHSKPPEYLASFQERLTLGSDSSAFTKDIFPHESSSSSSVPHSKPPEYLASFQERLNLGSQLSGQSSSGPFPRGQNQRTEFASQSHGGTQNQYQQNSNKNQTGKQHPRQSHGGRRNQEQGNQNWNLNRNFNGRGGVAQQGYARYAPPMPPIHMQSVPFRPAFFPLPYTGPMVFHGELAPPVLPYPPPPPPPPMPFNEPPPVYYQIHDPSSSSLETKIRDQVHYYFSNDNLSTDVFLRSHMNDEGFVHVQVIANFPKLKELTDNTKLILDSLRGSHEVEVQGYEIRKRHMWEMFLLPAKTEQV